MGFFKNAVNNLKDKALSTVDKSPIGTIGHNITDKYDSFTGAKDVREAQENYDKAINENTGENGMAKAAMQGQLGATSIGANAGEAAKAAAGSVGASKGLASALGEGVIGDTATNNLANETKKAADKNQEIVTNAGKKLEAAQSDMNSRAEMIGKAANLIGTGIGSAAGGPMGGMIGGMTGGVLGGGLNYMNASRAASDERLKYKSKINDKRLLGSC